MTKPTEQQSTTTFSNKQKANAPREPAGRVQSDVSISLQTLPSYCQRVTRDELEILQVRHPAFSADIAYQGAQILSFIPNTIGEKKDWLWLSPEAQYKKGQSIRGGIPICWPWFGSADKNPAAIKNEIADMENAPAHGIVRDIPWNLDHGRVEADTMTLQWSPDITQPPFRWPTSGQLKLSVELSAEALILTLTTTSVGSTINFSQALHTYLPTDDINQTEISWDQKSQIIDALNDWQSYPANGRITFTQETDLITIAPPTSALSFRCQTPQYRLQLDSNSRSAVIWNPWIEKAKRLSQFPEDGYRKMLCIETANVLQDSVILPDGAVHSLVMKLSRHQ